MKKYEVLFTDKHTEIVDHDTVDQLITELETFERFDVSQIHLLKDDGDFETIWTEEEGLFVKDFEPVDDEEDEEGGEEEEEFYGDGSELFSTDLSNITGVIEDIKEDLDLSDRDDKLMYDKMTKVLTDTNTLKEIKELCVDRVCDSDTICNYISDYSVSELGDMDGIWNEFGDILRETIYEYFED